MSTLKACPMLETRYYATKDGGGRIRVRNILSRLSISVGWDHALDIDQNHERAATMWLAQYGSGWTLTHYSGTHGGGKLFAATRIKKGKARV